MSWERKRWVRKPGQERGPWCWHLLRTNTLQRFTHHCSAGAITHCSRASAVHACAQCGRTHSPAVHAFISKHRAVMPKSLWHNKVWMVVQTEVFVKFKQQCQVKQKLKEKKKKRDTKGRKMHLWRDHSNVQQRAGADISMLCYTELNCDIFIIPFIAWHKEEEGNTRLLIRGISLACQYSFWLCVRVCGGSLDVWREGQRGQRWKEVEEEHQLSIAETNQ